MLAAIAGGRSRKPAENPPRRPPQPCRVAWPWRQGVLPPPIGSPLMKTVLLLVALLLVTASVTGCGCCFGRQTETIAYPAAPACAPACPPAAPAL